MTKSRRTLIPFLLLCLIGFATFFSSYLRIPVMPLLAATLGAGPSQVGAINGAFMLTAGLLSIPSGLLCLAVSLAVLGQLTHLAQLMTCAVVMGVGMALTFTAIGAMIAELVPTVQRGLAMGMYNSCVYLGMMAGATRRTISSITGTGEQHAYTNA